MKNKVNKFFKLFSGRPKDIGVMESVKIVPFTLGWIIAIGLMYYACRTNNILIGLGGLIFAWQNGWGMSIERYLKSEENKK